MANCPVVPTLLDTPRLLVIHKPANVPFHSDSSTQGIVSLLREQRQRLLKSDVERLYAVHRLDAVTSGCMLFAKDEDTAKELMSAFRHRTVSKYYCALSNRRPSKKEGSVKGDMKRGRRGSWMLERTQRNPAPAVTRFASTGVPGAASGLRAFLLKPETGKTHQLRVALKSLGSPVLGDQRYANKADAAAEERTYLHCCALRVVIGGRPVQVVSPPLEGAEFLTEGFRGVFDSWFPQERRHDEGVWFADNKLLRSSLEVAPPIGYGSLTQGSMF